MASNIEVKLDVLNQLASPALYAAALANRPAASFTGRLFIDSDSPSTGIYRDTGTTWVQVADQGAGTTGTLQQVTTNGNTTTVGIISNTVELPLWNTINSNSPYYFGSTAGSDYFKIFSAIGATLDQTEMVFQVGDNGQPYASAGQRFRFNYNAAGAEVSKDVLIVDYTSSYFNTNLGINTATPSSPFDVHTASGINATFNGTGTTNSILQFQLAGTGKWNLGNLYNAGANDFIIRDVTNTLNRITVKNTGQTFIGADTTSSGLLVVNSATSDNHFVAIGVNAPSLRLRDAGTGGVLSCGLGISTAVNNFIQGSASGNYCIFNSSTTASPILFGVYDSGTSNTQEALRISAARNFLIGTTTDSGNKLEVNGGGRFSLNVTVKGTGNYFGFVADNTSTTGGGYFAAYQNGISKGLFAVAGSIEGTTSGDLGMYAESGGALKFYSNGSVTPKLTISTTGLATFTNSIAIGNTVTAAVAVASTHKVTITIGGVTYYLLASNV